MKPSHFFSRRAVLQGSALVLGAAMLPRDAAAQQAFPAVDAESLKIGFGHVGPINDEGWTYTHHQSLLAVQSAYPKAKLTEVENIPFSAQGERTIRQLAAESPSMVFLTTDFGDMSASTIARNPGTAFLECASNVTGPNKRAYYIKHWDPSYIIGIAAGLLTKTNKLGYVGAYPTPAINASINSFHLGARSVNPKVETKVVYINSWFDPQGAAQAGHALIGGQCDFLFGIMDEAAYLQVAEKAGVWAAMWNTDMRKYGPNSYVSSVMLDWNKYCVSQVAALVAGTWKGGELDLLGMGEGTDRDAWGDKVPRAVRDQADAVRDKMLGGWTPFVGPMIDTAGTVRVKEGEALTTETLYAWPWLLEGVSASA